MMADAIDRDLATRRRPCYETRRSFAVTVA
jgi:hypothetical protein